MLKILVVVCLASLQSFGTHHEANLRQAPHPQEEPYINHTSTELSPTYCIEKNRDPLSEKIVCPQEMEPKNAEIDHPVLLGKPSVPPPLAPDPIQEKHRKPSKKKYLKKANEYIKRAQSHTQNKQYQEAIKYYTKGLDILEEVSPKKRFKMAKVYYHVGLLYKHTGNTAQIIHYFSQAWPIYCDKHDKNEKYGKQVTTMARELAQAYYDQKNYTQAIEVLEKGIEITPKEVERDSIKRAGDVQTLAHLYEITGNREKAKKNYEKGLRFIATVKGENHPNTTPFYSGIANCLFLQKKYHESAEYYTKLLNAMKYHNVSDHSSIAETHNRLGFIYSSTGIANYSKAKECYTESLRINKKLFGDEDEKTSHAYHQLGTLFRIMGNYSAALHYYNKVLHQISKAPTKHDKVYSFYCNLAKLYTELGRYDEAINYAEKTQKGIRKVYGYLNPKTAEAYEVNAYIYYLLGEYESAHTIYMESIEVFLRTLDKEHYSFADVYDGLGLVYVELGDYKKAKKYYNKSLSLREKYFKEGHPNIAKPYRNLCALYYYEGMYRKAFHYCLQALNTTLHFFGEIHPEIAQVYNNLGALFYSSEHDTYLAAQYYEKAIHISRQVFNDSHPNFAIYYHNLAKVYASQGYYDKALSFSQKALIIRNATFGADHNYTLFSSRHTAWIKQAKPSITGLSIAVTYFLIALIPSVMYGLSPYVGGS